MLHPEKGEAAGVGHYIHHLLPHLLDEAPGDGFVLFFDDRDAADAKREFLKGRPNATVRMLPFAAFKRSLPFVYSHMVVSSVFEKERLDLLHGPANVIPLFYKRPAVVTVHDLAIYYHPEWFPRGLPCSRTFSTRVVVPHSLSAARRIIAVSASTKRDLVQLFRKQPGKIDVIHEGAEVAPPPTDAGRILSEHGLAAGKYVLSLSTIEPRKNLPGLVRGFFAAASAGRVPEDVDLVIAGAKGWMWEESLRAIAGANRRLGRKRVRWIGYVPHGEKSAVMAGAAVFAYPSFYEGFGLPPLEAMALGVPVVTSPTSSLPEVCGDAALYVDPRDSDGLAAAIAGVIADPLVAADLARKGLLRAETFTWRKAAQETLACYRRAAAA